ncbi:hypothetical protein MIDIC_240060 [Alphaproteobacteria bacterium]
MRTIVVQLGSRLLNKVESEAKAMGASLSHLGTFDWQAKDFLSESWL